MPSGQKRSLGEAVRRVSFVHLMKRWLGKPIAVDLQESFGLSQAQAYRVLKDVREGVGPEVVTGDASQMLDFLRAQSLVDRVHTGIGLKFGIAVEDVETLMLPPVPEDIAEATLRSIRSKRALAIAYTGRANTSDRVISPTRLVHVLNRYHLRAWDHEKREFRDFLLSRITEAKIVKEPYTAPFDRDWQENAMLEFVVNPDLPVGLRAALAAEWNLDEDGGRKLTCRKAHARYVVRRLTERTTAGLRRWLPENDAARRIFRELEADVERSEKS